MRPAIEDYLKATLTLSETQKRVSTSALSEHLGVKPSSVTAMVKRLSRERPRLMDYKSHQGVCLTEAGKRIALDVVRRHRLIEQFLVSVLDYTWDEVHSEAHRLEHCVTPQFIDRIDRFLHHPPADPHGRPIPCKDGRMNRRRERPICEAEVGEVLHVSSVHSEEAGFLQYLTHIGLVLNGAVRILEAPAVGGGLRIEVISDGAEAQHVIGEGIATQVYVAQKE
jgi:DtxR family Mn-dependent transcriptional regulator